MSNFKTWMVFGYFPIICLLSINAKITDIKFSQSFGKDVKSNRPLIKQITGPALSTLSCSNKCLYLIQCCGFNFGQVDNLYKCDLLRGLTQSTDISASPGTSFYENKGLGM